MGLGASPPQICPCLTLVRAAVVSALTRPSHLHHFHTVLASNPSRFSSRRPASPPLTSPAFAVIFPPPPHLSSLPPSPLLLAYALSRFFHPPSGHPIGLTPHARASLSCSLCLEREPHRLAVEPGRLAQPPAGSREWIHRLARARRVQCWGHSL